MRVLLGLVVSFVLLVQAQQAQALNGADIGVYSDANAPTNRGVWQPGVTAITNMVRSMGLTCEVFSYTDLNVAALDFSALYRVIVFPGGWTQWYHWWISQTGKTHIRQFVERGGGFFGICAGAYFAADHISWDGTSYDDASGYNYWGEVTGYDLNFFPGTATGPITNIADYFGPNPYEMTRLHYTATNTVLADYRPGGSDDVLYYGGPWFAVDSGKSAQVLATYDSNGKPAVVASTYGAGRVVLSGPHPEIQEDSASDGVTLSREGELNDNGSEWAMMLHVFNWLLKTDNLVLPSSGGSLASFTSQYDASMWAASNVADGFSGWDNYMWCSAANPATQEFVFTFRGGGRAVLDRAVIYNHAYVDYQCRNVQISVSTNGTTYSLVASGTLPYPAVSATSFALGGVPARRVKLAVTSGYGSSVPRYWELGEFEVYGEVPSEPVDRDGDDLADTWEMDSFESTRTWGRDQDPDTDGASNYEEWIAGTDGADGSDVFALDAAAWLKAPGKIVLSWNSCADRIYTLQRAGRAAGSWTNVPGFADRPGGGPMRCTNAPAAGGGTFYRVKTRLTASP